VQVRLIDDGAAGRRHPAGVQWEDGFIVSGLGRRAGPKGLSTVPGYDDFGVGGASKYLWVCRNAWQFPI